MNKSGYTLIEMMVALVLSSVVVALSHSVFRSVTERTEVAAQVMETTIRRSNRWGWMVRAFSGISTEGESRGFGFDGFGGVNGGTAEADEVSFETVLRWWDSPRRIRLALGGSGGLIGEIRPSNGDSNEVVDTVVVADSVGALGLDYLPDYGSGSRWVMEWRSPVSAPVAVRMRLTYENEIADTLLFFVGERG